MGPRREDKLFNARKAPIPQDCFHMAFVTKAAGAIFRRSPPSSWEDSAAGRLVLVLVEDSSRSLGGTAWDVVKTPPSLSAQAPSPTLAKSSDIHRVCR
jgi:hypothetical protein